MPQPTACAPTPCMSVGRTRASPRWLSSPKRTTETTGQRLPQAPSIASRARDRPPFRGASNMRALARAPFRLKRGSDFYALHQANRRRPLAAAAPISPSVTITPAIEFCRPTKSDGITHTSTCASACTCTEGRIAYARSTRTVARHCGRGARAGRGLAQVVCAKFCLPAPACRRGDCAKIF